MYAVNANEVVFDWTTVLPEVIKYNNEGEPDSVSYARLSAVFIEAFKEQQQQIELLKQEINLLKQQ